ncbi:MAG: peroxiredoxin [Burkholderiaceae bacterium]|jgi:peroxiredoxin
MKPISMLAFLFCAALCGPAFAALDVGESAPNFTAKASLGGQVFTFSLSDALQNGPVVLYFYPAAFSIGCTIEAHDFAEAVDQYKALGATVIGVSHDDIDTLNKFSVSECRSKFAVVADEDQSIMKSYDAVLWLKPDYANRISYVIAPGGVKGGSIVYEYSSLNPDKHVANTLNAVKEFEQIKK